MATFRLADELEPPLPYEVSAARSLRSASDRNTRLAIVAMVGASVLFVGALVLLFIVRSHAAVSSATLTSRASAIAGPSVAVAVHSASSGTVSETPPSIDSASAVLSIAPSVASISPVSVNRPVQQKKQKNPIDAKPAVPPSPPAKKSSGSPPEIVNPWN